MIGARRVGMRADDQPGAAVDEMAERLLLAGRLGVKIDHEASQPRPSGQAASSCSMRAKGSSSASMKTRPIILTTEHFGAVRGVDQIGAAAGRPRREIGRADQPRLALDKDERLALVEGVIAERDRVGAGLEEFLADRLGDAEAAGGVFAVDDDEIEPPAGRAGAAIEPASTAAAGPSDDIADKEQTHRRRARSDQFALGQNEIEPLVVRLVGDRRSLATAIGDADRRTGPAARKRQRPVVMAAP